ncbi:MAG: hypothetical protein MO846_08200 [Candidatus Devosia symbiotica]|nr:hypothetical protein [Candidatus Devosia symbiotica]
MITIMILKPSLPGRAIQSVDGVVAMLTDDALIMIIAERADGIVAVGAVTRLGEIALNYVAP